MASLALVCQTAYCTMPLSPPLKPVEWMGSALDDLRARPEPVQDEVGYAIHLAQLGEHPPGPNGSVGNWRE